MSLGAKVKWPGSAYDAEADDLGEPLQQLLVDLHVLEAEADRDAVTAFETPFSVQVITSGATALTEAWAGAVAALGGGGALAAALKGLGYGADDRLRAAVLVASAAVLASAVVLSVAGIVKADVTARATAAGAQYRARSEIAAALLASAHYNVPTPPPPPAPRLNYVLQTPDGLWFPVKSFRTGPGGVVADLIGRQDPVQLKDVSGITATDAWDR